MGSADLRSCFEELGFRDVDTFRTSGNVVFVAGREPRDRMADRIERGLADTFGFEVTVFLRTAAEIRAIADRQPFDSALVEASEGKLHVVMLAERPPARARKKVLAQATDEDRLELGDRELYWLPSGGIRDSGVARAVEKLLAPTTMRTKDTIEKLAAKYFAD